MKPEDLRRPVKDALEHLFDTAYLEVHPLLTQVPGVITANRSTKFVARIARRLASAKRLKGVLPERGTRWW